METCIEDEDPFIEDKDPCIEDRNPCIEDGGICIEDRDFCIEDGDICIDSWCTKAEFLSLWQFERHGPPVVGPNPLPELTYVGLALESSSYLDRDFFTYAVLNAYMGGGGSFSAGGPGKGMYTHIYRDVLTQHHWVYWATAQNHAYLDSGIFCLLGSAHPSQVSRHGYGGDSL